MTAENSTDPECFRIHEVMKYLPHRYPFLLIDRVTHCLPGQNIIAIKNVTINEPFFQGHFPSRPVMPGVLILEAMAQTAGILAFRTANELPSADRLFYLVGIDNARFKNPVEPGDQLTLEVHFTRSMRDVWKFTAQATVMDKFIASAELMCARRGIDP